VSPVKYELGFYIPEDDILHSHSREKLKPYNSAFTFIKQADRIIKVQHNTYCGLSSFWDLPVWSLMSASFTTVHIHMLQSNDRQWGSSSNEGKLDVRNVWGELIASPQFFPRRFLITLQISACFRNTFDVNLWLWRMETSRMLRRVPLLRIVVSEKPSASIIKLSILSPDWGAGFLRNVGSYKSHTA
jgi:hypothetical protein